MVWLRPLQVGYVFESAAPRSRTAGDARGRRKPGSRLLPAGAGYTRSCETTGTGQTRWLLVRTGRAEGSPRGGGGLQSGSQSAPRVVGGRPHRVGGAPAVAWVRCARG